MSEKILFQNPFIAIVEREGYSFLREVRCDGKIVALLPFRQADDTYQFLARLEICPAHSLDMEQCSITGGVVGGEAPLECARRELAEEAGYQAETPEFIPLGQLRPTKSSDTTVFVFAVEVTHKPSQTPQGDGSRWESGAGVQWVTYAEGLKIQDPLFIAGMVRLLAHLQGQPFEKT